MAMAALKIKIMPESPETDLDEIKNSASCEIEKLGGKLHNHEIQPIAFGLNALILTVMWPEHQDLDLIENAITKISGVNSVEVIDFRRAIG
ncbi:MAG: elongation factor 1-beta [Candidatus Pacearchaeota archaeon]